MKLRTHDVTLDLGIFGEHTATIKYNYYPAWPGTRFEPPEPAEFELDEISIGGVDVGLILSADQFREVKDHILDQLEAEWEEHNNDVLEPW